MVVDVAKFTLAANGIYVVEISDLQMGKAPSSFTMTGVPEAGMCRCLKFSSQDIRGGEVVGWNYEEMDGPNKGLQMIDGRQRLVPAIRVLIIND